MSAADSSQLIDSPAAGRLGENRAFFYSEEQGRLEKFRPYSPPEEEALADFKRRFDAKPRRAERIEGDGLGPKAVIEPSPVEDLDFTPTAPAAESYTPRPAPAPPKADNGPVEPAKDHGDLPDEDEWLAQFKRQIDEQRRQQPQANQGNGSGDGTGGNGHRGQGEDEAKPDRSSATP
jgi:hypothetical protein